MAVMSANTRALLVSLITCLGLIALGLIGTSEYPL